MKILIDNGHGFNTPGKCSPDKRLLEWAYTREIAIRIVDRLKELGYDAERVVTEDDDISLKERCRRINAWCSKLGAKNCLSVSVHCNAAGGDGQWHNARGWQVYVSNNASSNSKKLAQLLYAQAEKYGLKGNRSVPKEKYWVANLAMCRDTNCPAVLTENMFQDNKEDVDFLLSEEGKQMITYIHVNGIIDYVKSL